MLLALEQKFMDRLSPYWDTFAFQEIDLWDSLLRQFTSVWCPTVFEKFKLNLRRIALLSYSYSTRAIGLEVNTSSALSNSVTASIISCHFLHHQN